MLTLVAKVIVLDSDALVTSRACFDEWTAHREEVIAQVGGAPGCPSWTYGKLGFNINSGAMLLRGAPACGAARRCARLASACRQQAPGLRDPCYEQELLNKLIATNGWARWLDFPNTLALEMPQGAGNLTIRLLNTTRWPQLLDGKPTTPHINSRLDRNTGYRTAAFPRMLKRSEVYSHVVLEVGVPSSGHRVMGPVSCLTLAVSGSHYHGTR